MSGPRGDRPPSALVHFRYAWIAPAAIARLTSPAPPPLQDLGRVLVERPAVLALAEAEPPLTDAGRVLRDWLSDPRLSAAPGGPFCRRALEFARDKGDRSAEALAGLTLHLVEAMEAFRAGPVDPARERAVIEAVAAGDFPLLLLWSAPETARLLFERAGDGARPRDRVLAEAKTRRRTIELWLRYSFASLGRTAPRDGWTGAGFGVIDPAAREAPVLRRRDEVLAVEPDLAWFDVGPFAGRPDRVLAGESAWDHVMRRLEALPLAQRRRWRPALAAARARAAGLGENAWRWDAAEAFLSEPLIPAEGGEPHRWWITRMASRELAFPPRVAEAVDAAFAWDGPGPPTPRPGRSEPWPLALIREAPEALLVPAEEMTDQVADRAACDKLAPPRRCAPEGPGALVVRWDAQGLSPVLFDPNPRRASERFAALMPAPPAWRASDRAPGLRPPDGLVDNRLLRLAGEEVGVGSGEAPTGDLMFRTTLNGPAAAAVLARELASPRYHAAPDIEPLWFDAAGAVKAGFGRVDPAARIWLLQPQEARALAAFASSAAGLAALWRIEVAPRLGDPDWLDLIVEGKRSRLWAGSVESWGVALVALRAADAPVAAVAPAITSAPPALTDEGGDGVRLDLFLSRADGGIQDDEMRPDSR